jgi:phosphoglycerate dehydrogenase-like enzyme
VTIWGYGNIAKRLTPSLQLLGANVKGIARSDGVREGVEVHSESRLESLLEDTDALVMILPGSESTKHALNSKRIQRLPKHAWVINVGRGTSIDEDALADALDKGDIGGAALDVFEKEPLPQAHRFWHTPNTIVSPHAAGGRPQGKLE